MIAYMLENSPVGNPLLRVEYRGKSVAFEPEAFGSAEETAAMAYTVLWVSAHSACVLGTCYRIALEAKTAEGLRALLAEGTDTSELDEVLAA